MTEHSGKEEYDFLAALVRLLKPKKILEIGTSSGRGTFTLAQNCSQGSEIVTVDCADHRNEEIRKTPPDNIRIRFIQKPSDIALKQLLKKEEYFDLILIDGDHHYETVKKDWYYASKMADTIILHDAIQFNGVRRVINEIRRDLAWGVSTLSYPGTTLFDNLTGKEFYSNRCPGIAIATRITNTPNKSFKHYLEHPSPNSRRALKRRKNIFKVWHTQTTRGGDFSFSDWEMLFHALWNFNPDAIVHLGHVGTDATLIFMNYAKSKKIPFLGIDPTGNFWSRKREVLPQELKNSISATILEGMQHASKVQPFIQSHRKTFLWVDEFYDDNFYQNTLPELLKQLPIGSVACVRNFSPYCGEPNRVGIGEAECTNPRAHDFCRWLAKQPFAMRLASPEATFGDYVNAGHWLLITPDK